MRRLYEGEEQEAMEMNATVQALYITAVGMGLVFLALGIVLLAMLALRKAFPRRDVAPAGETSQAEVSRPTPAQVAAIAVALARSRAEARRPAAPAGPSGWLSVGRSRQLQQPLSRERKC